jgi:hypothetical protein
MPNWCNNVVTITHIDEKAIDRICDHKNVMTKDLQGNEVPCGLFETFHPIPEPLRIPAVFGDVDFAMEERQKQNIVEYGAATGTTGVLQIGGPSGMLVVFQSSVLMPPRSS